MLKEKKRRDYELFFDCIPALAFESLGNSAVCVVSPASSYRIENDDASDISPSFSDFRICICFGDISCKDETSVADSDVSSSAADLYSGRTCGDFLRSGMEPDGSGMADSAEFLSSFSVSILECSADDLGWQRMGGLASLGALHLLAGNNSAAFNHPFFQHSSDIAGFVVFRPRIPDDSGEQLRRKRPAIRRAGLFSANSPRRPESIQSNPGKRDSQGEDAPEISEVRSSLLRSLSLDNAEPQRLSFRASGKRGNHSRNARQLECSGSAALF